MYQKLGVRIAPFRICYHSCARCGELRPALMSSLSARESANLLHKFSSPPIDSLLLDPWHGRNDYCNGRIDVPCPKTRASGPYTLYSRNLQTPVVLRVVWGHSVPECDLLERTLPHLHPSILVAYW